MKLLAISLLIVLCFISRFQFLSAPLLAPLEHVRPFDQDSLSAALIVWPVLKGKLAIYQVNIYLSIYLSGDKHYHQIN